MSSQLLLALHDLDVRFDICLSLLVNFRLLRIPVHRIHQCLAESIPIHTNMELIQGLRCVSSPIELLELCGGELERPMRNLVVPILLEMPTRISKPSQKPLKALWSGER